MVVNEEPKRTKFLKYNTKYLHQNSIKITQIYVNTVEYFFEDLQIIS